MTTSRHDAEESVKKTHTSRARRLPLLLLIALLLSLLAGCSDFPYPSNSAVLTQGHGLPDLRLLDWGFFAFQRPVWSPDGRWIAVLAGEDFAGAHVEVVSPDGKTRYDLSSWGCGEGPDPEYAWLPDSRLSCINDDKPYSKLCIDAAPFTSCAATRLDQDINGSQPGIAWTPDGRSALYTAWPNDGSDSYESLYVLAPDGSARQILTFPGYYGVVAPSFRPHQTELAYFRGASADLKLGTVYYDLVIGSYTEAADGKLTLGAALMITSDAFPESSSYAWSPSGRWLAMRIDDYHGNDDTRDRIALINADNPGQIVDVVQTYQMGDQWMMDPVWSPDGKTLIVLGGTGPQPYSIDIAGFLASKGLQP